MKGRISLPLSNETFPVHPDILHSLLCTLQTLFKLINIFLLLCNNNCLLFFNLFLVFTGLISELEIIVFIHINI